MRRIRLAAVLVMYAALFGFVINGVSAQEIPPAWHLIGGVYQMISSPYIPEEPEDRDPQVSLFDDLGSYNTTQWRLFRYDYEPKEERCKYFELKTSAWSDRQNFGFGRGYWIISRSPAEIDVEGAPVGQNWIVLEHEGDGWNQIGDIFDYDFPIVSLYVARESTPLDQKQLIDEANNDLTYVTLQEFEKGLYIDIPTPDKIALEVGKGYWLRVLPDVNENVRLYFVVKGPAALSMETYFTEEFFERVAEQEDPPDPPPAIQTSSSVTLTGGSGGGGGGCFVATATYGRCDHPRVQLLRRFRDQYLLPNSLGRIFVDAYYRYSPWLARFLAGNRLLKASARFTLMPAIGLSALTCKTDTYGLLVAFIVPFLVGVFLLKREVGGRCKEIFSGRGKKEKMRI